MTNTDLLKNVCEIYSGLKEKGYLVHCITNPISINDCANILLAVGARPIMAEHPLEVAEITATAAALTLNIGNITDARMESMIIACKKANELKIPVVMDLVGASCSSLRREYLKKFMSQCHLTTIKGNISELRAVCGLPIASTGIDASAKEMVTVDNAEEYFKLFSKYARENNTTILATGPIDLVTDSETELLIQNGNSALAGITGTGCMLNVLVGAALAYSIEHNIASGDAVACACLMLEIAGEKAFDAYEKHGPGTFHVELFNKIHRLTNEDFISMARITR